MAILASRLTPRHVAPAFAVQLLLGLGLAAANYQHWDGYRAFAAAHGARCVEAYPLDAARKLSSGELYVGRLSTFRAAGFVEVLRRAPTRPIVRRDVSPACPRS